MKGSLSHLVKRFFDVLLSKPLSSDEISKVENWLVPALAELFFEQPPADQRHGYRAALVVVADADATADIIEAALMHDIGKRHASLGILGRTIASILIKLGVPLPRRMMTYRDHGPVGAHELAAKGASRISVEFAAHHHGSRPGEFDPAAWNLLLLADEPPNPRSLLRSGITSDTK